MEKTGWDTEVTKEVDKSKVDFQGRTDLYDFSPPLREVVVGEGKKYYLPEGGVFLYFRSDRNGKSASLSQAVGGKLEYVWSWKKDERHDDNVPSSLAEVVMLLSGKGGYICSVQRLILFPA